MALSRDAVSDIASFRQESVSGRICEIVRKAIIQLQFRPGDVLSETALARELSVSRQPVREAFIKLADAGLVEVRPQRGTFVRLISHSEVESARYVRESVEIAFARAAATKGAADIASDLHVSISHLENAGESENWMEFLRLDEEFHQAIARGAGYENAWRMLDAIKAQMDRVRFLSLPDFTPASRLVAQHKQIADSIAAGDPDGSEQAMRVHLDEIRKALPKITAAHPDLFAA